MTDWRPPEGWRVESSRDRWTIYPPDGRTPAVLLFADYPSDCGLIAATRATINAMLDRDPR